jgi:hypothetical protein
MGCGCAQGIGESLNTYDGPAPEGVPNPYHVMLHSYPTRYHGPIYTRPMFGKPWIERPNDFALEPGFMGLGDDAPDDKALPPIGRVAVAVGLSAIVIWGAMKFADTMART